MKAWQAWAGIAAVVAAVAGKHAYTDPGPVPPPADVVSTRPAGGDGNGDPAKSYSDQVHLPGNPADADIGKACDELRQRLIEDGDTPGACEITTDGGRHWRDFKTYPAPRNTAIGETRRLW